MIGFEIKFDYSDFRAEIKNPNKTEAVRHYCTEFYFVTPEHLVSPDEIPKGCGLIYYREDENQHWPLYVRKRSDGGHWWLAFEEEHLIYEFHKQREWEEHAEVHGMDEVNIPKWMLPRYIRPLHFQFDVYAVAAKMAAVALPEIDLEAGMEAF